MKVIRMRQNQCHCVRLIFLIPAVYLLSQTESVWRRYRDLFAKPNRQNFWMLTVPVRTVRTMTWQDHTDHTKVMWQLLVGFSLANMVMKRVALSANGMRARGPMHGRHVSLVGWSILLCKIVCGSLWGLTLEPPPLYKP